VNQSDIFAQPVKVKFYGLANCLFRARKCVAGSNASRQIWHIRGIVSAGIFDDYRVAHKEVPYFFNPDCLRILFNVPGAKSSLGLPATVTRPGFLTQHAQYVRYFHGRS